MRNYLNFNCDKELLKYTEKKSLDSVSEDNIIEKSPEIETLNSIAQLKTIQKKATIQLQVQNQEYEKMYKEKIEMLEKENLSFKNEIKALKNTETAFVKNIINIMDELDRLNNYARESGNEKLINTLKRNFKVINNYLNNIGIEKISTFEEIFNENFHDCIEIEEREDKNNMEILEEIKSGYMYKGYVERAAQVIINKRGDN